MTSGLLLAFLAGLVTILNPCVLPLVPILVGSA
ncbi:MAG: Cytochrome C biogenesis protein transmembrane region, partial [Porphyrobacter sp. HL-46]